MLLLAKPMGLMPQATLAAVVIVYSVGLISLEGFRSILAVRRTEFLWAVVALAGVLLLGTLQGILVAIVVSVVALAQQVANPPVYVLGRKPGTNVFRPVSAEHPEDETLPGPADRPARGTDLLPQRAANRRADPAAGGRVSAPGSWSST